MVTHLGEEINYYHLDLSIGICVLAFNSDNEIVVIEQFKPTSLEYKMELLLGGIEPNLSPLENAKKEFSNLLGELT